MWARMNAILDSRVELRRTDGNTHYFGGLVQSQGVKVYTPDLCFLN